MKNTVLTFQQAKKEGTRLSMLTADMSALPVQHCRILHRRQCGGYWM